MNKNKISKIVVSFFLVGAVAFSISGCSSSDNNSEEQITNEVQETDTGSSGEVGEEESNSSKSQDKNIEAKDNQQTREVNQDRQMQEAEADPVLQAAAEAILSDTDLFGELNDEVKETIITTMQPMIFSMLNEKLGFSLQNGIIIIDEDLGIDITIYQSEDAVGDAELFANSGDFTSLVSGDRVADRQMNNGENAEIPPEDANGQVPNTEAPNGEAPNDKVANGQQANSGQRTQGMQQGQSMNIMPDISNSESKVIGNYIIFANTDNNEEVFSICESNL
ncbi:hypothetical protein [Clostridium sp. DL1XJH146]